MTMFHDGTKEFEANDYNTGINGQIKNRLVDKDTIRLILLGTLWKITQRKARAYDGKKTKGQRIYDLCYLSFNGILEGGLDMQPTLTIANLERCFYEAEREGKEFVGVLIKMEGFPEPEVIINSRANFDAKLAYYRKAYDANLVHRSFSGIKIIGFTYGHSFESTQHDLLGEGKYFLGSR